MKHYETVIIGGGIVGAGIFRDLCLHGISTLIIDKNDFSSETSERSSKLLHGGIRYLENFDFKLVFEALHEKNAWIKIAPHLCFEAPFYLFLYDFLSGFSNSPHSIKSPNEMKVLMPILNQNQLTGAGLYHDAVVDDAKMCLEVIYDGLMENKSLALNHHEIKDLKFINGKTNLIIKNNLTDELINISANNIVFAVGPYTDQLLKKFPILNWNDVLLPSKGSHLWISKNDLPIENPLVITTDDNRVIFVVPHQEKILVGTTEIPLTESIDQMSISKSEMTYLLNELNLYFPTLNLNEKHILSTFSGVRPLIKEENTGNRGRTSREHKVYMPNSQTYVIAGGKYTTFRVMGQEITKEICHKNNVSYNPDRTLVPLRKNSVVLPFQWKLPNTIELQTILSTELPKTFDDLVKRRLSISSRSAWALKTKEDFDQYFLSHLPLINNFFPLSENAIKNFI
jgi:glycerol-3-phosphate dehydrogenase